MINIVYMVLKKRNLYNIITDSRCAGFAHKYIHIISECVYTVCVYGICIFKIICCVYIHIYAYINIAEHKYTH